MKRSSNEALSSSVTASAPPEEKAGDPEILYDPNGPFEEFGVDPSDSEPSDDDDDDDNDDDDIYSLPRALLEFALITEDRDKAEAAITKAATIQLSLHADIASMLKKAKDRDDGKVPPGSSEVKRDYADKRFLLCQIFVLRGKFKEIRANYSAARDDYREALVCFPKSIEANLLLAKITKALASTTDELKLVEKYLRKAVNSAKTLGMITAPQDDESLVSIHKSEQDAGAASLEALHLLLCQEGRFDEADALLIIAGFQYRLANEVFHYNTTLESKVNPVDDATKSIPVKIIDNAVSDLLLDRLKYVFREDGPFWKEHDYDVLSNASRRVGYFSYLYPMKERPASNVIEQLIDAIFARVADQYPVVRQECNHVEWWVHLRPHSSGHQLHFDSDETAIESGKPPMHPIVSSVLYLSGSTGGPTLVTNQLLKGDLATEGWLVPPKKNRLATFDAKYLHGVIPGRGPAKQSTDRRLTFMVGFWRNICAIPRGIDVPGPGQALPIRGSSKYTWIDDIMLDPTIEPLPSGLSFVELSPSSIPRVWQKIEHPSSSSDKGSEESHLPIMNEKKAKILPSYEKCFQGF